MPELIPKHDYQDFAGTTQRWMPMDTQARWQANWADPMQREQLIYHGWTPDREITYSFNSHGFRSGEFQDGDSVMCLGCSFIMGIGLPIEQTWPSVLEHMIGVRCWNLGLGGAALDTLFRIADHYVARLRPRAVLCLVPESKRVEIFVGGQPLIANWVNKDSNSEFFRHWLADDHNSEINQKKNLLAIHKLCDQIGVPFLCLQDWREQLGDPDGLVSKARDLMHYGHLEQHTIAEKFRTMISIEHHK